MTEGKLARRFADWSVGLEAGDVPTAVRVAARRAIVDTLGVTVAGGCHRKVRALAGSRSRHGGPCGLAGGGTGDAETAALVNGMAAHVWDFDDTSYSGIMHGSAVVLPAVLALAEDEGLSDEAMTLAFIAGSEVTYTLAELCTHDHYFKGWWSTVTFGVVGATAAAAKLLGLEADAAAHAIAMAAGSAGGGKTLFGTDGKPYLVGEVARRAIGFARAARAGLTGPLDAFEDSRGYLALLNGGHAAWQQADTLGRRWRLVEPGLFFKTSPVCSAAHAAIDGTVKLLSGSGAEAGDIERIEAAVPELVAISLVHPWPSSPAEAQFSLPYALACAVLHGRVRLRDLAEDEVKGSEKTDLMNRVTVRVAPDLSTAEMRSLYPESARIAILLKDGRRLDGFCGEAYGMPQRPMSDKDLLSKFADCLTFAGNPVPDVSLETSRLLELARDLMRLGSGVLQLSRTGRAT